MRAAACKDKAGGIDSANSMNDGSKAKKAKKDDSSSKAVTAVDFECFNFTWMAMRRDKDAFSWNGRIEQCDGCYHAKSAHRSATVRAVWFSVSSGGHA